MLEIEEAVEHGTEFSKRDLLVEILIERFEVDVGGIEMSIEIFPSFGRDISGRNGDGFDILLMARLGDVDGVLHENRRVVVGEGDAFALQVARDLRKRLRTCYRGQCVEFAGFRDVPILAEFAAQIASGSAE